MENAEVIALEMDKFLNKLVDRIFALSQQNLIDDGKVDTGTLLKTANINRDFLDKEIVYPAPYADNVEYGRLPGTMPPTQVLKSWISRKLKVKNPKQVERIAWAIAKAIEKRGIEPSPFLRPAIHKGFGEVKL